MSFATGESRHLSDAISGSNPTKAPADRATTSQPNPVVYIIARARTVKTAVVVLTWYTTT
eukprot:3449395-Pyramimonas_sp.AAC.1